MIFYYTGLQTMIILGIALLLGLIIGAGIVVSIVLNNHLNWKQLRNIIFESEE